MNNQPNLNSTLDSLRRLAEQEEAQTRKGSTLQLYEKVRRLAEGLAALENDAWLEGARAGMRERIVEILAIRDLPDNAGCAVLLLYRGKPRHVAVTFEELKTAREGDPMENEALYARWKRELKLASSLITDANDPAMQELARRKAAKPKAAPNRSAAGADRQS